MEKLLTIKQVSERLNLSPQTIRRLVHTEGLPAVRVGRRRWGVPADRLMEWLKNRTISNQKEEQNGLVD